MAIHLVPLNANWQKKQQMRRHKKLCSILKIRGWPAPYG